MDTALRLPEPLATAWSKILSGVPLASVRQGLVDHGLLQGLSSEAAVQEVRLRFDFSNRIASYAEQLRKLEPLGLSIAPVVVGVHGDPRDAALLTRYPTVSGQTLRKMRDGPLPMPAEARDQLHQDLHKLWDAGLDHPWALRGYGYWLQGDRTGAVVLDGWEALRPLEPSERAEKEEALRGKLG
jgi:hypothetical protein